MILSYVLAVVFFFDFVFLMIRRPPRSTQSRSSAASDVYKRQVMSLQVTAKNLRIDLQKLQAGIYFLAAKKDDGELSLIHISEPTRPY